MTCGHGWLALSIRNEASLLALRFLKNIKILRGFLIIERIFCVTFECYQPNQMLGIHDCCRYLLLTTAGQDSPAPTHESLGQTPILTTFCLTEQIIKFAMQAMHPGNTHLLSSVPCCETHKATRLLVSYSNEI